MALPGGAHVARLPQVEVEEEAEAGRRPAQLEPRVTAVSAPPPSLRPHLPPEAFAPAARPGALPRRGRAGPTCRSTMSFSRFVRSKPFSKTRWTAKVCWVRSRRLRLCAPSTTCTVCEFLRAARGREGTRGGPGRWGGRQTPEPSRAEPHAHGSLEPLWLPADTWVHWLSAPTRAVSGVPWRSLSPGLTPL